jgi:hypothetical protein
MSKVSAMQAMREARYATRPATKAAVPAVTVKPTWLPIEPAGVDGAEVVDDAVVDDAVVDDAVSETSPVALWPVGLETPEQEEAPAQDALCGHRSMNNRNCRRPAGHPEKNHRYS